MAFEQPSIMTFWLKGEKEWSSVLRCIERTDWKFSRQRRNSSGAARPN